MNKKPELAYISPLPPEKSGISFYSKELLPYLSEHYHLTLIVDQEVIEEELRRSFKILHYKDFLSEFKKFDRILYHFGNSSYHKHMLYLIEEIPGICVLHDVFISGLVNWLHATKYYENVIFEEAYYSHGWAGILKLKDGVENLILNYPLNGRVINSSIGVILHSSYALKLMENFYSFIDKDKFKVIPHLRTVKKVDQESHINDELFICHFGYVTTFKLPEIIIEGFALSELSGLDNVRLVFVGEAEQPYKEKLLELAQRIGIKGKVSITGFLEESLYKEYLKKVFIGIQLRQHSRGETSGPVLDLLSFGKPVIINAHGTFKEFPEDTVYFLPEEPKPDDLASALNRLYRDNTMRLSLSQKGSNYIREHHDPKIVAQKYKEAIEGFYANSKTVDFLGKFTQKIKDDKNLKNWAFIISKNFHPLVRNKNLFVDISHTCMNDYETGISRVVKAELKHLLTSFQKGLRIEPVRLTDEDGNWLFKYARRYTKGFIGAEFFSDEILPDTEIEFREGDIYYAPDLNHKVTEAYKAGVYDRLRLHGVKIAFLIHDLLPIEFPNYFGLETKRAHEEYMKVVLEISDLVLCTSHATASSLNNFAKLNGYDPGKLRVEVIHLGADFSKYPHRKGLAYKEIPLFQKVKKPYFLMVSTIEPRKGHLQTIKAFEILWGRGYEIGLVIAGKEGWMTEDIVKYIKSHQELDRKLFWLGYVSDEFLERLYSEAFAAIMASEGEGFGLPILEAAHRNTPIIARDIPVFREIAQDGAYYFPDSKDPAVLAESLQKWLSLYENSSHPKPDKIKWMTWEEHGEKLKEILMKI